MRALTLGCSVAAQNVMTTPLFVQPMQGVGPAPTGPLLTGPLVRNPRPYEPRLPDPKEDLRGYRPWPWGKKAEAEMVATAVSDPPEGSTGPRLLPDILQPELIDPAAVEIVPAEPEAAGPEVAERPKRSLFR